MDSREKAETKNAKIVKTTLGYEDHGILSYVLHLDYGGLSQGFGAYALDKPVHDANGKFLRRTGSAYGMETIARILKAVGVDTWEQLPGKHIRVRTTRTKVEAIGNILKDEWFCPEEFYKEVGDE